MIIILTQVFKLWHFYHSIKK